MKGFTPPKKHANEFKYTPRFYDPKKEERERRRAELRGEPVDPNGEYTPGDYIRRQREARAARRNAARPSSKRPVWFTVIGLILIFMLAYIIFPRIMGAFDMGASTPEKVAPTNEYEEFDPYAPIRIVPND